MEDFELGVLAQVGISSFQQAEEIQSSYCVEVILGEKASRNYGAQVSSEVVVNLLAKLFPHVKLDVQPFPTLLPAPLSCSIDAHLHQVRALARKWPQYPAPSKTVRLVVGSEGEGDIYVVGNGWLVGVGPRPSILQLSSNDEKNPLGPVMSGILGCSEVFKRTLGQLMPGQGTSPGCIPADEPYIFSLLDYNCVKGQPLPQNSTLSDLALENPIFFGIGSVGSACLHALSYFPDLSGRITVVDHDSRLDRRNLLRYSFLTESDLEQYGDRPKTEWIMKKLKPKCPKLEIEPCKETANDWLGRQASDYKLELAISAVDSAAARIQVAEVLAKRVVNAATGSMTVDVTRHGFGEDGKPCLACLYEGQAAAARGINQYADTTGIPHARIVELVMKQAVLNESDLNYIVARGIISPEVKRQWLGGSLASLLRERRYAGVLLTLPGGRTQIVTLAFVSQMAGTLLAAEVIKESKGLANSWHGTRFSVDARFLPDAGPISDLRGARDIDGNILAGRCLCEHGFRREIYNRKYQSTPAVTLP